jgi:hypothetical protein
VSGAGRQIGEWRVDAIQAFLKEHGIKPVIRSKSNRKKKIRHDKKAY